MNPRGWDHHNVIAWGHRSIFAWDLRSIAIRGRYARPSLSCTCTTKRRASCSSTTSDSRLHTSRTQHSDRLSPEGAPHAQDSEKTPAGRPRGIICGINTKWPRATDAFHRLRVHPQANFKLRLLSERSAHQYQGQDADTGCIINR